MTWRKFPKVALLPGLLYTVCSFMPNPYKHLEWYLLDSLWKTVTELNEVRTGRTARFELKMA